MIEELKLEVLMNGREEAQNVAVELVRGLLLRGVPARPGAVFPGPSRFSLGTYLHLPASNRYGLVNYSIKDREEQGHPGWTTRLRRKNALDP